MGNGGRTRLSGAALVIVVVGLVVTTGFVAATRAVHRDNQRRLTAQRAREAAAVLAAGVPNVVTPLETTSALAEVSVDGDTDAFRAALGPEVGPQQRFASASLWPILGASEPVTIGGDALLERQPEAARQALLQRAQKKPGSVCVLDLVASHRLGYAIASARPGSRFVLYAERALPPQPSAAQAPDSPFIGLDYALYLGSDESPDELLFSSTPRVPLRGERAVERIPFADTSILLVMVPASELGGSLLAWLPWITGAVGVILIVGTALFTEALQRRRQRAERLAAENERLYAEQRVASETLQRGLLPRVQPAWEGVEIRTRYFPKVAGTEVGGDWYDAFTVGDRIHLVVGDVSGNGLSAAAVMGAIRFSMRALAEHSAGPAELLTNVGELGNLDYEGHFATVVCATLDASRSVMTVASAGHPPPLLIAGGDASYIELTTGPPLGVVDQVRYQERTVELPADAVVLFITDGVIERRGRVLDEGLERLRELARDGPVDVDTVLERSVDALVVEGRDDAAALAVRLTPAARTAAGS